MDGRRPVFADLLRRVGEIEGIRRVRYTSPHPKDIKEDVALAMAETPAVCEQLHLPLQSGSARILRAMQRGYTPERFLEKLRMAERIVPGLATSTDIIVGFPGETEDDFAAHARRGRRGPLRQCLHVHLLAPARDAGSRHGRPGGPGRHSGAVRSPGGAAERGSPWRRTRPWSGRRSRCWPRALAEGSGHGHRPDPDQQGRAPCRESSGRGVSRCRHRAGCTQPSDGEARLRPVAALVGPPRRASPSVALLVAERVGAEIVSVDSMQVYRGMDIGTAKPELDEQRRVRLSPRSIWPIRPEPYSVAEFQAAGREVLDDRPPRAGAIGADRRWFGSPLPGAGRSAGVPADRRWRCERISRRSTSTDAAERNCWRPIPSGRAVVDLANPRRVPRALEILRLTDATPTQRAGVDPGA